MFVILFTVGIVFNLIGFDWLTYLGIALVVLSGEFLVVSKEYTRLFGVGPRSCDFGIR